MRKILLPQAGAVVIEFALALPIFLMLIFSVIELARISYLFNTLQEVTRRAATLAANTDFTDAAANNAVRQAAVFRIDSGTLALGAPVTDAHVRIDYLSLDQGGGSATLPEIPPASLSSCPASNRIVCMKDGNASNCIRFVRARICDPGNTAECARVPYQAIVSFISLPLQLPMATRIVTAESLGFVPGMPPCP